MNPNTKICRACGKSLPLSEFRKNSETHDGYRYKCKTCDKNKVPVDSAISKSMRFPTRQYSTRKSREGLDQIQAKRAQKYGLTVEQLEVIYQSQDGLCGICSKKLNYKFCIDHCHVTNIVRGLLCSGCNTGLGQLGDNIEGLQRAIAYLLMSKENPK